jgi:hypothetical protein
MLRLALRTNVHKLQLPSKLTRVTWKPRYHLFYIALLTSPGVYQHGLLRFSQLGPLLIIIQHSTQTYIDAY